MYSLDHEVKRFGDDCLNEDLARGCTVKARHVCDQVWQALGPNSSFASPRRIRVHAKSFCLELACLQDYASHSKLFARIRRIGRRKAEGLRTHDGFDERGKPVVGIYDLLLDPINCRVVVPVDTPSQCVSEELLG